MYFDTNKKVLLTAVCTLIFVNRHHGTRILSGHLTLL